MSPMMLFLTCATTQEAKTITESLLDARLVVCVKWLPVTAHFLWDGKKDSSAEVMLIMETVEQHYDAIYACVKALHSYDTFVLQGMSVGKTSESVQRWIEKELGL